MSIYHWYEVKLEYVEIKFVDTLSTDSLTNDHFTLSDVTTVSTPITDPFKPINVTRDYYSISRTLRLWFNFTLESSKSYQLDISGLKTVINSIVPSDSFTFETGDLTLEEITNLPPTKVPVDVEDYSIKNIDTFIPSLVSDDVSEFEISIFSPGDDIRNYMATVAAEGRIDVKFNQSPAANYVTSDYFKVQRKLVSRTLSRWEDVNALVTADTVNNYIYIYLPSSDDPPVYGEPDKEYWIAGYKYKLKILAGIGI